ncbi:hypothetical protein D3C80_1488500 [compost metagenome]
MNFGTLYAGQIWTDGLSARGEDQCIITLFIFTLSFAADSYRFILWIYGNNFAFDTDINVKAFIHRFRSLYKKLRTIFNMISNIVGQTAVCKRNIGISLEHDDLSVFVKTTQSGCC